MINSAYQIYDIAVWIREWIYEWLILLSVVISNGWLVVIGFYGH